ncbi:MAG: hypothetical protein ACK5F2_02805 [Roseateles sp.]
MHGLTRHMLGLLSLAMALPLSAHAQAQTPAAQQAKPKPSPSATPGAATKPSGSPATKAVSAPGVDSLVEEARRLLATGQASQAMSLARKAGQQAPNDYRPPYYLALALLMLGEPAAASEAQQRSASLAPNEAARGAVAQLGQRIAAQQTLSDADAALAEGLYAKAAGLLDRAWKAEALSPQRKLAYAELLQGRQADLAGAVAVLRARAGKHLGTPEAETAVQRLQALAPELSQRSREQLALARRSASGSAERLAALRRAIELDADHEVAAVLLADELALGRDWEQLRPALMSLHRKQWLQAALERRWLTLDAWQGSPELLGLFGEIWGPERARSLLQAGAGGGFEKMEAERLARAKAEAAADYERAMDQYQARQREIRAVKDARETCLKDLETAEYGPDLLGRLYYTCKKRVGASNNFQRRMSECMDPVQSRWKRTCESRHPLPQELPYPKSPN